jgi:DNA topoisomerase-3
VSFRLIVTEKPSVARDIARVLGITGRGQGVLGGNGPVRITWCLGHLTELAEPASYSAEWKAWRAESLPMLPEVFALQPRKSSMDQWRIVRELLRSRDLEEVVNGCDAGREGELIFANTYRLAGCKAPVMRLWISSMTAGAIRTGFDRLRPGADMSNLEAAARSRSEADWLVGLNATRAMTLRMRDGTGGTLLSLGRVQTPTLAILCEREDAIEAFEPQEFWRVVVRFGVQAGEFDGSWFGPESVAGKPEQEELDEGGWRKRGGGPARVERIWRQNIAQAILDRVRDQDGVVVRVERKDKREKHPLLYDLTALQKEANKRFKWSAQHTLNLAQALYEQRKVITYPRTDSRHLTQDQVPGLSALIGTLAFGPYQKAVDQVLQRWPVPLGKRVINDAEVTDHHAIIPTGTDPRRAGMTPQEKWLFDLVARRFLAAFHPDAVFATQLVEVAIAQDHFRARGRALVEPGWRLIDPPKSAKQPKGLLPRVDLHENAANRKSGLRGGSTKPPRRHTEATLLGAMERAGEQLDDAEFKRAMKKRGLGTPATRAAIIETLLRRDYVLRRDNELVPTPQGRALMAALPVQALRSARLTGEWEARLVAMAEGGEDRETFMRDIRELAREMVVQLTQAPIDKDIVAVLKTKRVADGEVLGTCPLCQSQVRASDRGWACTECDVWIPRRIAQRDVSPRMAKALILRRETIAVKGWKNKSGKLFTAALRLDDEGKVGFHFPEAPPLGPCPACGKPVRARGRIWTCDTGRACAFVVFEEMSGFKADDESVRVLLADGSGPMVTFVDRSGLEFTGRLTWTGQRVQANRVDPRAGTGPVVRCPRDGGPVRFYQGRWRCESCAFALPAEVASRPLLPEDVHALCRDGATIRLYGFRQGGEGPVMKAAMVLRGDRVQLDWSKDRPDWNDRPVPPGQPPPAFGPKRTVCPRCLDQADPQPGWIVAGRSAWGCSKWRAGCPLRVPFQVFGSPLLAKDAERLLGKLRATTYARRIVDERGSQARARVVLDPLAEPNWSVQVWSKTKGAVPA